MAKTFLTNINLKGNQLLNAVIHSASSAPSALAAGQLYFNTGDNTFYYSTGTGTGNWQPVGVQYVKSVGSNLSVDFSGQLNLSDTPTFSSIALTSNGNGDNITIGDDAYIGDMNVANHIVITGQEDATKGGVAFGNQHTEKISSNGNDLTLSANNDIILLPGSNYAYLGAPQVGGGNRIATLNDINGDATITSVNADQLQIVNKELSLTNNVTIADKLTIGGNTFEDAGILDVQNASGFHMFTVDTTASPMDQYHGYNSYTDKTGIINVNSFINISSEGNLPSGYLFMNVYGASNSPTLHLESKGDLALRAGADGNDGNIILYTGQTSSGQPGKAYIGWNHDQGGNYNNQIATLGDIQANSYIQSVDTTNFNVDGTELFLNSEIQVQKTSYWRDGTQQGIIAAQSDGSLRLTGIDNGLQLEANSGNVSLTSYNGDITFNPDGQVIVQNGTNLVVGNNIYVKNGIYAGGNNTETDGYVRVQDANGNNVFTVTADGTNKSASVEVHGTFNFYDSYYNNGTQYGSITVDNDQNFVINANQNNLILQSDSSNVYIGSVTADNKVAKFSDLTSVQSGLTWKEAVNLLWDDVNASNSGATGTLTIDGHPTLTSSQNGYRILIPYGETAGIWSFNDDGTNWTLTRTTDADTDAELKGAAVFVEEGSQYGSTAWVQSNHYLTDFTGQSWVQFSGQGTYVGSNSIGLDGNSIYVKLDSDSLNVTSSGLKVNYHTDGGLDNDTGLYVKTADGIKIDNAGNVAADYTAIESQLVTDGFVKTSDITTVTHKYTQDIIGDGSTNTYTITHNLDTQDIVVRVWDSKTGSPTFGQDVEVDVVRSASNANIVNINFAVNVTSAEAYSVVVIG